MALKAPKIAAAPPQSRFIPGIVVCLNRTIEFFFSLKENFTVMPAKTSISDASVTLVLTVLSRNRNTEHTHPLIGGSSLELENTEPLLLIC